MRRWLRILLVSLAGCGSSEVAGPADTGSLADALDDAATDAATDAADGALADAPDAPAPLRRCPASGQGAVAGDECFLLSPAEAGLPAGGANAGVDQYALRPTSGARGKLVVFFNGSGGSPAAGTRGSPTSNFYATARAAGLHLLALSYRSDDAIGSLCKGNDACFLPTRRSILTGSYESGAASALSGIALHEGALARLIAGLRALDARDPAGGWGGFLDAGATTPATMVRWSRVIAAGHSQGGGHAALVGRSFAIDRVVALSAPCDATTSGPASWLDAAASPFATSPAAAFHGLGAQGDVICPGYAASWGALGLAAARRHADATVCAGAAAHGATIECVENAPTWSTMLE